jgi:hypothetical protein
MDYTSIKVGQLPTDEISGGNFIPHEVAGILKKATFTDLAAFIGASDAVGFKAVSVQNGDTLPATSTQEFILVGPGTYNNVGGGSTITVTEELNALVSNGTYWFIGVEIPIDAPPGNAVWGQIIGTLSNQTDLQNLFNLKADLVDGKVPSSQLPSYVDDVIEVANYAALPATGETGKIYITIDTEYIYRWSGSAYIRIVDEAAAWGTITGTLSNQTDLQNALNSKEDDIAAGTTAQYWRGDKSWQTLNKAAVGLSNVDNTSDLNKPISTATQTALDGKFDDPTGDTTQYIAGDGSLISFPISGQAGTLVREVRNTTGATLTKGTVVYINGASGNKPTVTKALATGDSTSAQTFGLIQADISNNANGYVVCIGDLIGVNTSGISVGTQLYLSSSVAGEYTTTKQYAPNHLVYVGVVTRSHATLGQIEVKIQNGYELDEIHDVAISSVANNEVLVYESSTSLWKNKTIPTILGYTPQSQLSGTGFVKISGTTISYDTNTYIQSVAATLPLGSTGGTSPVISITQATTSSNGYLSSTDWNTFNGKQNALTNPITGTGTTNYLPKFTGSTALGNSLIYDNGTNVIIGSSGSTGSKLYVLESGTTNNTLLLANSNASNTANLLQLSIIGSGKIIEANNATSTLFSVSNLGGGYFAGNVGIGTTSPQTALDVINSGTYQLHVASGTGSYSNGKIYFGGLNTGDPYYYGTIGWDQSDVTMRIGAQCGNATGGIAFYTSPSTAAQTERMRITSGGLVGIGTTSPYSKLEIVGAATSYSNSPSIVLTDNAGTTDSRRWLIGNVATDYGSLNFAVSSTNSDAPTNSKMTITKAGNVGIGTTSSSARLSVVNAVSTTATVMSIGTSNNGLNFIINSNGAPEISSAAAVAPIYFSQGSTRVMTLSDNSNVGIGTTSPSYTLHVNGSVAGTSAYNNLSDKRYKKDILPIQNALDKILALNGVTFNWDKEATDMNLDDNNHIGLLAQDVEEILPQAVTTGTDENKTKSVAYTDLVPVLIEAIKELKAEIEILKNK